MFKDIVQYIYAGNSTFSLSTPNHKFYYNVKKKENIYLVYSLKPDRLLLGKLILHMKYPFFRECSEYGRRDVEVFETFIDAIHNEEYIMNIKFAKENTCAKCGKLLTDEASIKRGYGPECWRKIDG